MRQDMSRMLVKGGKGQKRAFTGRRVALLEPDEPVQVGRVPIRPARRGWDSGHTPVRFSVLRRFLASCVGQPWDRVFAQASRQFLPALRQSTGAWLAENVSRRVYRNSCGELVSCSRYFGVELVTSGDFYVDPETGLLCGTDRRADAHKARQARQAQRDALENENRRIVSDTLQYHRRDGVWFEVVLKHVDDYAGDTQLGRPWDSLQQCDVTYSSAKQAYGTEGLYAHSHRTLGHKELRTLSLA